MRRRSTALVAVAVALLGLVVGVTLDQVDDGDEASSAPSADACLDDPPLVVVGGDDGQVTVIRPDGGRAAATAGTGPDLSPAADRLVVTRPAAGGEMAPLWTIGLDGSDPQPLTDGEGFDRAAAWSPDGATVAFARLDAEASRIMAVPATGGAPTEVVAAEGDVVLDAPTWSPDGSRLAYVQRRRAPDGEVLGAELWTVAADGSGPARLAEVEATATSLDWHPDGSRLLVGADGDGQAGTLALVEVATGTHAILAHDAAPGRWSRRGTRIVHLTRTGVTREAIWRLVESAFAGGTLRDPRDLGVTGALGGASGLAVAACP